jgi:2-polyprenyl-3-methyl-5-hydroxy-6-metoxy-1,4-benzoquinol methylase
VRVVREYVFDQSWSRERDRLRGLESLYDEATTRYLMSDAPEEGAFDIVHARAVVEHIPDHHTALAHLLAAVRPGVGR